MANCQPPMAKADPSPAMAPPDQGGQQNLKFRSSFPASGFPTWPPIFSQFFKKIPSIPFSAPPFGGGLLFGGGWLPLPPAASLPNSIIPDQRRQPPTIGARLKRAN